MPAAPPSVSPSLHARPHKHPEQIARLVRVVDSADRLLDHLAAPPGLAPTKVPIDHEAR